MNSFTSDLVRDLELKTIFEGQATLHIVRGHGTHQSLQEREERWRRKRKIGNGSFGVVWLEECITNDRQVLRLRAVKEIVRKDTSSNTIDYGRELEAMAKFSDKEVSIAECS
jgi:hypothetical protein